MTIRELDGNIELTIIIVDDSRDDHFFIKESLCHLKKIHFQDFYDGEDFLDFLEQPGIKKYPDSKHPVIVILDVNMPKLTGFEVFDIIMKKNLRAHFHFFILTTSITEEGKSICKKYALECHQKPFLIDDFTTLLEKIIKDCI
ncbi:MAG: response regulator [Bacteroidia bacterium]